MKMLSINRLGSIRLISNNQGIAYRYVNPAINLYSVTNLTILQILKYV